MSDESGFTPTGDVEADTTIAFHVSDEDGHFGQSANVHVYFSELNALIPNQLIGDFVTDVAGGLNGDFNLPDTGIYSNSGSFGIFATNFVAGQEGDPDTGSSFAIYGLHVIDPNGGAPPLVAGVLTATSATATTATLSFTDPTGGTAPYNASLQRSPDGVSNFTQINGAATSPATASGLVAGTTYYFKIVWTDSNSGTVESNVVSVTTGRPPLRHRIMGRMRRLLNRF